MADQTVAFHLRTNKSVERALFLDLLSHIGEASPLRNYVYMSMGGEFLYDHAIIHKQLGIEHLLSIEKDAWRVKRQLFNRPVCCIDCREMSDTELVENFDEIASEYGQDKRFIIWLDYMKPKDRGVQLREVRTLAPKLGHGDVLKITMNAHLETLRITSDPTTPEERVRERYTTLVGQLNDYYPEEYEAKDIEDNFAGILGAAFALACMQGIPRRHIFMPLAAFTYSDGQQMVTFAGIVLNQSEQENFITASAIKKWRFYAESFSKPLRINVPLLSVREKTEIDRLVGGTPPFDIRKETGVTLAEKDDDTVALIGDYAIYYRFYPHYVQAMF